MSQYVTRDGKLLAPAVARAFDGMDASFGKTFPGLSLAVTDGRRTKAQQETLFLERYRPQLLGKGPFGDVRWWRGKRYVRISPAGTVAVPGTSKHENDRAVDIRDTGRDAGVTRAGTPRANWLRANSKRFGFDPAGYQFGEPWHYEYTGDPWEPAPAPKPAATKPKPKPVRYPTVSVGNLGRIGDVRGLQKIARQHGYTGRIDNKWGPGSQRGFKAFLKANGYKTVDAWLRKRWGYKGDNKLGPVMTQVLRKANVENYRAL